MRKNKFISYKIIIQYIFLFAFLLILGYFLKNLIGILSFSFFLLLLLLKRKNDLVIFLILWLYLYNFYIGQGWITNSIVLKYLLKGQLYIILTFFYFFRKSWLKTSFDQKLFYWGFAFILISLISDIFNFNLNLNFLNQAYFIFLFFLILNLPSKKGGDFEKQLLNLLIAIGIFQIFVSFLQVNQYINPPIKLMKNIYGKTFLWQAGLDDAASGTFGAGASNSTSWFETFMMLFFFSYGFFSKKKNLMIFSFLFLLHYTMVDSKTALGITLLTLLILLFRLQIINIIKIRNFIILFFIISFSFFATSLIKQYYTTKISESPDMPINLVIRSYKLITNNFWDWGKIAGFKYITKDYLENYPIKILVGYGRNNYTYDKESGRIEMMDTPAMRLNNITRSRSAFIAIYGMLGLPGLFMLLYLFKILMSEIKKMNTISILGKSFKYSGTPFLTGSMIFMFLYGGHNYRDLAFVLFFIFYALILRVERKSYLNVL